MKHNSLIVKLHAHAALSTFAAAIKV